MKKIVFTLFFVCLFISLAGNSYSQSFKLEKVNQTDLTKINNPFDAVSIGTVLDGPNPPSVNSSNITVLPYTNSTSGNARAPQGGRLFANARYIITGSEMTASGFGGSVTSVGWSWNRGNISSQGVATTGNLRVYLKDTTGAATTVSGTYIDTTGAGFIKVIDGTISIPAGTQQFNIDVPVGGPGTGTFTPTPGSGVVVIFVYKTTTPLGLAGAPSVACNVTGTSNGFYYFSGTTPGAIGATSLFRAETRFGSTLSDNISLQNVIAYGEKIAGCVDTNFFTTNFTHLRSGIDTVTMKYVLRKVIGGAVKDSFSVSFVLNDTAATTAYYISLPMLKNGSIQDDSLFVTGSTKASEDITSNNSVKTQTSATYKTMNQAITNSVNNGGAGFSVVNGEAAMALDAGDCGINISKINYFFGTTGQSYNIKIQAGDSGMTPGTVLYNSGNLVNTTGANSHTLSTPVYIPGGRYFVVFNQVAATNFSLQFQSEIPIRNDVYYTRAIPLQNSWVPSFGGFKYNVQVETTVNLNLGLYLEGFFNGTTMVGDTVRVNLRSQTSPYPIVDTDQAYVNATGNGTFNFTNASANTCYFYELVHRNHIRTYSNSSCNTLNGNSNSYDFKSANSQSFGPNMIFVSGANSGWATYTADVNQDNVVDLTDYGFIDNDAANFVSGYVVTDVNGDEVVDVTDAGFSDNNAFNFVGAILP